MSIYSGHLRREPEPCSQLSCASYLELDISNLSDLSIYTYDTTVSNMSFNITSDGSPTPRKTGSRLPMPADLRLDTSPEVLGFGPVGTRIRQLPSHYWPGSALLTSNVQGAKRPTALGSSTLGNLMMPPQGLETLKVRTQEAVILYAAGRFKLLQLSLYRRFIV